MAVMTLEEMRKKTQQNNNTSSTNYNNTNAVSLEDLRNYVKDNNIKTQSNFVLTPELNTQIENSKFEKASNKLSSSKEILQNVKNDLSNYNDVLYDLNNPLTKQNSFRTNVLPSNTETSNSTPISKSWEEELNRRNEQQQNNSLLNGNNYTDLNNSNYDKNKNATFTELQNINKERQETQNKINELNEKLSVAENDYKRDLDRYNIAKYQSGNYSGKGLFATFANSFLGQTADLLNTNEYYDEEGNLVRSTPVSQLKAQANIENASKYGKLAKDAVTVAGELGKYASRDLYNMATMAATGGKVKLGTIIYDANIFKNSYNEIINEGGNETQAMEWALFETSLDLIFETIGNKVTLVGNKVLNGKLEKGLIETTVKDVLRKIGINNDRITSMLIGFLSEGFEEGTENILEQSVKKMIMNKDIDIVKYIKETDWEEVKENAWTGGLVGGVASGISPTVNTNNTGVEFFRNNAQENRYYQDLNIINNENETKERIDRATKTNQEIENDWIARVNERQKGVYKRPDASQNEYNDFVNSANKNNVEVDEKLGNAIKNIIDTNKKVNVTFDKYINGNGDFAVVDGVVTIRLNPNSSANDLTNFVLNHEIGHLTLSENTQNKIIDYAEKTGRFNEALQEAKDKYGDNWKEEFCADFFGKYSDDANLINDLKRRNNTLYENIKSLFKKDYKLVENKKENKTINNILKSAKKDYATSNKTNENIKREDYDNSIKEERKGIIKQNRIDNINKIREEAKQKYALTAKVDNNKVDKTTEKVEEISTNVKEEKKTRNRLPRAKSESEIALKNAKKEYKEKQERNRELKAQKELEKYNNLNKKLDEDFEKYNNSIENNEEIISNKKTNKTKKVAEITEKEQIQEKKSPENKKNNENSVETATVEQQETNKTNQKEEQKPKQKEKQTELENKESNSKEKDVEQQEKNKNNEETKNDKEINNITNILEKMTNKNKTKEDMKDLSNSFDDAFKKFEKKHGVSLNDDAGNKNNKAGFTLSKLTKTKASNDEDVKISQAKFDRPFKTNQKLIDNMFDMKYNGSNVEVRLKGKDEVIKTFTVEDFEYQPDQAGIKVRTNKIKQSELNKLYSQYKNILKSRNNLKTFEALDNKSINKTFGKVLSRANITTIDTKMNKDTLLKGEYKSTELNSGQIIVEKDNKNYIVQKNGDVEEVVGNIEYKNIIQKVRNNGEIKKSKFNDTMLNSPLIPQDFKDRILNGEITYEYKTQTNETSLQNGLAIVTQSNNLDDAINNYLNNKEKGATRTAQGIILSELCAENDDYKNLAIVTANLQKDLTISGQEIQILAMMKRLTPSGMKSYIQEQLNNSVKMAQNGELGRAVKKYVEEHKEDFVLTIEEGNLINDCMLEYQKEGATSREKQIALAKIDTMLSNKLAQNKTFRRKAGQFRTTAMLLNPRTLSRNILANVAYKPLRKAAKAVATGVDKIVAKKTGVRTIGLNNFKVTMQSYKQGLKEAHEDWKLGIDTKGRAVDKLELNEYGSSFEDKGIGKAINRASDLCNYLLDLGDRPFYAEIYNNSIANQLKLNNTTEVTEEMIKIATDEALDGTFQSNDKKLYKFAKNIRTGLNSITPNSVYGLGDFVMPIIKTSANLTQMLYEYSPLGSLSAIKNGITLNQAIKDGTFTAKQQHDFVMSVGKVVSGAIIMTIGGALSKAGVINVDDDDDKDKKNFDNYVMNKQKMSFNVKFRGNNYTFSFDWADPISNLLAISHDLAIDGLDWNTLDNATQQVFESSVINNLSKILSSDTKAQTFVNEILNNATSFYPNVMKQIGDIIDPVKRETYVKGETFKNAGRYALSKSIIGRKLLTKSVNTLGEEKTVFGNLLGSPNIAAAINYIVPSTIRKENRNEIIDEINNVYNMTKDKTIMPITAAYSLKKNGEDYILSTKERKQFQEVTGKKYSEMLGKIVNKVEYKNLTDEEKANALKYISQYTNYYAKKQLGYDFGENKYTSFEKYINDGNSLDSFFANKKLVTDYYNDKEMNTYNKIKYMNFGYDEYKEYSKKITEIKNKYSGSSTAVKNARKKEIENYLDSLQLSSAKKLVLYKTLGGYSIKGNAYYIKNYLDSLDCSTDIKSSLYKSLIG